MKMEDRVAYATMLQGKTEACKALMSRASGSMAEAKINIRCIEASTEAEEPMLEQSIAAQMATEFAANAIDMAMAGLWDREVICNIIDDACDRLEELRKKRKG